MKSLTEEQTIIEPTNSLENLVRRWLKEQKVAISGHGGHDQTFFIACSLIHGFNLDEGSAFPLMLEYNKFQCQPEWTEKELRHKLQDASRAKCKIPRGYLVRSVQKTGNKRWKETEFSAVDWRKAIYLAEASLKCDWTQACYLPKLKINET